MCINFFLYLFSLSQRDYNYPGYQRSFSRAAGIFGVGRRSKPRAAKPREKTFRAGHCIGLTETGNRARKVSGTQGRLQRESA